MVEQQEKPHALSGKRAEMGQVGSQKMVPRAEGSIYLSSVQFGELQLTASNEEIIVIATDKDIHTPDAPQSA